MNFRVKLTYLARRSILDQAAHIAVESQAPLNAQRWLDRVDQVIDSLAMWPRRHPLAFEDTLRDYEIRQANTDGFVLLFTIDDDLKEVRILAAQHGRTQP